MKASRPFRLTSWVKPEHELQAELGDALARLLPSHAVFTSWDLASDSASERVQKHRRYCLKGWPDCSVWFDGRVILLELKRQGGYLSAAQRELHPRLAAAGHPVAVVHSLAEALDALSAAGCPLRGRIAA